MIKEITRTWKVYGEREGNIQHRQCMSFSPSQRHD